MQKPTKLFNRNFLFQFTGQSVSRLGSQGFSVAIQFWILQATGSASLMGLVVMFSGLPAVLLGPIAGTFADRFSRRKIIIISDLLRGLAVLSLSFIIFLNPQATQGILVYLFLVAIFIAVVTSFFGPAITASIPDIVPADRVVNANSLGQLSTQLSVFIGQGLGGVLFRLLGAPVLFLVNGLTYLFASGAETFVEIPQIIPESKGDWKAQFRQFGRDILDGLRYVWRRTGLRETVLISAFLSFFSTPVTILLPIYVTETMKAKTDWFGFLLAAYGAGTLFGYVFAGLTRFSPRSRARMMIAFSILQAVGYGLLGLLYQPSQALVLALLGGFTSGFFTVNLTTILQVSTPGEIRGRVFGLLTTISASLAPISAGLSGVVADLLNKNIPLIYVCCGLIMVVLVVIISLNSQYRDFLAYDGEQTRRVVVEPAAPLP